MRIVLVSHPSLGSKVLETLIKERESVAAVFIAGGNPEKPSPLKTLAQDSAIPVYEPGRMKDAGVYETMAAHEPELGVLAFVQDIVPVPVLNCPKQGTIMFHPSLLPRHRGGTAMNWTIIQGETRTGITIIWPDAGIDTGPMLLQQEAEVLPDDTVGSLFFDRLYPMGVAALAAAVKLVKEGKAPRIPQDESRANYEPLCGEKHAAIDWSRPAGEVYNLIRGTNPRPGARTTCRGELLKVFDSGLVDLTQGAAPGEIVLTGDDGFTVACRDGAIAVRQVQTPGSPKTGAADFAISTGLKPGDRLG
jgi:methionyl-tRNA formyltransferase